MENRERMLAELGGREPLLDLLEDMAKRWLAHDGLWFQAVEKEYGMEAAIKMDAAAWEKFTVIEVGRIKKILNLPPDGGIPALKKALGLRLYSFINEGVLPALRMNIPRSITAPGNSGLRHNRSAASDGASGWPGAQGTLTP